MKDAYQILGINKSATQDEIKSAYRKLVRNYHPDLHPNDKGAEDKFKEITQAYELIGDAEKRKKYDRGEIGSDGKERPGFNYGGQRQYSSHGQSGGFGGGGFSFDDFDLGDLFSGFGMPGRGQKPRKPQPNYSSFREAAKENGKNLNYSLNVSFIEAALGISKEIKLANAKKLKLNIPKGTVDAAVLRLKGQGAEGKNGGSNGDALITIKIQSHPIFKRQNNNVTADIPITLKEAIFGEKINVPTLDGIVAVNVPKNSNSGTVLRLKGKGIETKEGTGDLLLTLMITIPEKPDKMVEEFALSWDEGADFNPRKKLGLD